MTERVFRIIQGIYLLIALFLEINTLLYIFIAITLFEAITNLRIPIIVSKIRSHTGPHDARSTGISKFSIDAEQMERLIVGGLLIIGAYFFPQEGWFIPWFMGGILFVAGSTNFCLMVITLRKIGFR